MSPLLVITRLTLLEASRRRILQAAIVLGVLFLGLFSVGFYFMRGTVETAASSAPAADIGLKEFYNFLLMAGLYAISFLSIAMGAILAADTLAGEVNSGTIQALVAKPIRRAEIVLGQVVGLRLASGRIPGADGRRRDAQRLAPDGLRRAQHPGRTGPDVRRLPADHDRDPGMQQQPLHARHRRGGLRHVRDRFSRRVGGAAGDTGRATSRQ